MNETNEENSRVNSKIARLIISKINALNLDNTGEQDNKINNRINSKTARFTIIGFNS